MMLRLSSNRQAHLVWFWRSDNGWTIALDLHWMDNCTGLATTTMDGQMHWTYNHNGLTIALDLQPHQQQ